MMADHKTVLRQLKTIRGQMDGIIRMVEEDRYCIDISNQVLATRASLNRVNQEIIKAHMEHCIMDACTSGSVKERKTKIEELSALLEKLTK
jgi:DNA-binding FrmR family transcriptional regulator